MLKEAEQILGYDILKLCTEGPKEKLDDTTYAQVPTVFNSINTSKFSHAITSAMSNTFKTFSFLLEIKQGQSMTI